MTELEKLRQQLREKQSAKIKISTPVVGPEKVSTPTISIQSPAPQSVGVATLINSEQVLDRIQRLQESLRQSIPGYESLLFIIHRQLSKDPELTHLLKPEQIGTIVEAMKKKKNIVLVEEKAKKLGKKALKDTTVDDL